VSDDKLTAFMKRHQERVNTALKRYVQELDAPERLKEAMAYSLLVGGKRIRPIFLEATIDALGGNSDQGLAASCALEMIHTYSLIHDDLPAMDDDDYRRGQKTNHKVFGEATAILAGDALLTHAFSVLTAPGHALSAEIQVQLVSELSRFAGAEGMVGGQMADLLGENGDLTLQELSYIHEHKTGDLLKCAVRMGCHIGGANEGQLNALSAYAFHIGMAFQIQDDILDEIGDEQKLGKQVGSDRKQEKTTYVSICGLDGARQELNKHIRLAKDALLTSQVNSDLLLRLADFMINREH
jgi:geranylgeranyl diphosphate synthase, type II